MDAIPSSPAQIYRNMLILEESLRSQYLALRARRYKYTLFSASLLMWTAYFYYGVFIQYSVYTSVHLFHKLGLTVGIVTLGLFYLSGLYSKTMVYPRRFLPNTNKGLRQFNLKLVSTRTSSTAKPLPYYHHYYYHYKPPGGEIVKLVMIPKAFSPEFREGWEIYRQEYWEQENERRAARSAGRILCHCAAERPTGERTGDKQVAEKS
ncbi:Spo7-like protein-domain-containing protein [Dipodascopsis tothii]|uniref:Spo7-like protein-domain-containing protein n=1 Tax=Dipodascopsis tothii TaxID=44089 RepID=UPI0034CDC4CF